MKKRVGFALVAILIIVAAVAVFSGVLERFYIAPQLSPTTQQVINPDRPVSKSPFTTLGTLKDAQVKLDVTKATVGIVDSELKDKTNQSQVAYNSLFGSLSNPGLFGAILLAAATGIATNAYNKSKLYTPDQVKLVKNGDTIL